MEKKWEEYAPHTHRLLVEGGFLYFVHQISNQHSSMCFVPDVDLQRYQSHLRDAYKQGYQSGHIDATRGLPADCE